MPIGLRDLAIPEHGRCVQGFVCLRSDCIFSKKRQRFVERCKGVNGRRNGETKARKGSMNGKPDFLLPMLGCAVNSSACKHVLHNGSLETVESRDQLNYL